MNTGFYKDLDTNFEQALALSEKNFTHSELIDFLKTGNIPQKQIAAIKLEDINSCEEANILVSNLTGCDGKIRESVALKINQLLRKDSKFIDYFTQAESFAKASIDINANICRLAIDSAGIVSAKKDFLNIYSNKILEYINDAFSELDKFIFKDKKYVINKQLFKLYWSLEALKIFSHTLNENILIPILDRASAEREYTIREKAAQIVIKQDSDKYDFIINRLKSDENYYIKSLMHKNVL